MNLTTRCRSHCNDDLDVNDSRAYLSATHSYPQLSLESNQEEEERRNDLAEHV